MAVNYTNALDTQHMSSALHDYEIARSGFFTFIVDGLEDLVKYAKNPNVNGDTYDGLLAQNYIALSVVKAPVPQGELGTESIKRGNEVINFATTPSWSSGSLTVDDFVGLDIKNVLMSWWNLAYNVKTGKGGYMKDYKKKCTLIEYTQNYEQIRSWTLYGCFITKVDEGDFDKENDGKRQITVNIVYDRAIMNEDDSALTNLAPSNYNK